MSTRVHLSILAALCVAGSRPICRAANLIVDISGGTDFSEIDDAVSVAQDGDTIVVMPGTYTHRLYVEGLSLTIRSAAPQDANTVNRTILDGSSYSGRICRVVSSPRFVVEGLTFFNGREQFDGAAIHAAQSDIAVRLCAFRGNHSLQSSAGAIYTVSSTVHLESNAFYANTATIRGAAVRCFQSHATIVGNMFIGNQTLPIGCDLVPEVCNGSRNFSAYLSAGSAVVQGNVLVDEGVKIDGVFGAEIRRNEFRVRRGHTAVWIEESDNAVIQDNVMSGDALAAGITSGSADGMRFVANTIVGCGVGIGFGEGHATLKNNIIAENKDGVYYTSFPDSDIDVQYNCSHNVGLEFYKYAVGEFEGTNNIFVDPDFAASGIWDFNGTPVSSDDTYWRGDPHLGRNSPCIDSGAPDETWPAGATDIDGHIRVARARADMGAYEYPALGDLDGDGQVTTFDIDAFVLALIDRAAHAIAYPIADALRAGDMNGDGNLDNRDIDPFVTCIVDGYCP